MRIWIPAYAGMTMVLDFVGGIWEPGELPPKQFWIPAFAGMTGV